MPSERCPPTTALGAPVPPTLGLRSVSKLFCLLLISFGVLMTLPWIAILIWAAIYLAQHVF
jgi:hypothetical protein